MMKKIKNKVFIILALIIVTISIGSVYAYMIKQTQVINNQFIPAEVSCVVDEEFNNNTKSEIMVQNTSNIDTYIRLRLVSYWVNAEGQIVDKPSEMPQFTFDSDKWIEGANYTYYYKEMTSPNELTTNLFKEGSTMALQTNVSGYNQVVEVFAEAIQANPKTSVIESWNVSLDTEGIITSVN